MMKQVNIQVPRRLMTLLLGLFLTVGAFAQQITVKGHVKDATGEGVIGATVRAEGTQGGAVTDFDGNFTIQAKKGATITITYMGYQPATVAAAPTVEVMLQDDAALLNEVVVIGYGQVKKSDLTGSVTALKPDSKNKGLVVSAQDMLGGKVAGVNVTNGGGTPGGGATIRIRGGSSLNASNDPLIVIDGIPVDNTGIKGAPNMLATINPQDIESFNVLKDASATAIYGSRGSNGVIIITTKKGRKGQAPQVQYAGSFTVSMKQKSLDVIEADEYRAFVKKIWGEESDAYRTLGTANTDWQDEIYRTALSHDHNITVSGAYKNLPYRVSVGYTGQQGILKTSDYDRYTASVNLNPSLLDDHLTLNLNAKGMYARSQYANEGAIGGAFFMDPTQDPHAYTSAYHKDMFATYDSDPSMPHKSASSLEQTMSNFGGYFEWPMAGNYNDDTWPYTRNNQGTTNPLAMLEGQHDVAHSRSFIGSADIDYKIHGFEDLRLHATLGADISTGRQVTTLERWHPDAMYYGSWGYSEQLKRNLSISAYAQYYKDFAKIHHFDIMGGYEWQHFWHRDTGDGWGTYPITNNDESLRGTQRPHTLSRVPTENYLVSYFGRANYTLLERYYLTATVRDDGSSRFKDHWAWFPSFAFAWKIKDEAFLKNSNAISDLKLRLGYGKTGQQDVNNDYAWIPVYEIPTTNTNGFYPIIDANGDGVITTEDGQLNRPGNYTPELKWETTTTYNVGIDWGVMNQRLTGSIDWYYRKTTDLLNYAPTAPMTAFRNKAWQNIGSLKNTGLEASISWKAIQTKDWFWVIDYNITYNKNEITDLNGVDADGAPIPTGPTVGTDKYIQYNQVGHPANSFLVYQQVYDESGLPLEGVVVDRNGDGEISEADRYFYKSPMAPVTMGLSTRLEYKKWDLGMNFRASFDNYVFNNISSGYANINRNYIYSTTNGGVLNNRPVSALEANWQTYDEKALLSDRHVQNASFLKCDNITLGYSFDSLFKCDKYKGIGGRVYASASNVFTITNYDGIDPEIFGGYDNQMYPRPISFIVGLNLNF